MKRIYERWMCPGRCCFGRGQAQATMLSSHSRRRRANLTTGLDTVHRLAIIGAADGVRVRQRTSCLQHVEAGDQHGEELTHGVSLAVFAPLWPLPVGVQFAP